MELLSFDGDDRQQNRKIDNDDYASSSDLSIVGQVYYRTKAYTTFPRRYILQTPL